MIFFRDGSERLSLRITVLLLDGLTLLLGSNKMFSLLRVDVLHFGNLFLKSCEKNEFQKVFFHQI